MKWKPEETDIIDYLYGSMTNDKKVKFEGYLKEHPDLQKEVNELRQAQKILPSFQDHEVIPPLPIAGNGTNRSGDYRHWLYPVSIAASIAAILIIGYFTNFRMSFNDEGFELGFVDPVMNNESLNQQEIEKMIAASFSNYDQKLDGRFASLATDFEQQLLANQQWSDQRISKIAQRTSPKAQLDDSQVLQFIAQLKEENGKQMQNFYQASADDQRTYLRNILLEYSEYIENQRQEDLQYIQANLRDIRSDSDLKKEATDKILANIITTVNNQNLPINDRQSLD